MVQPLTSNHTNVEAVITVRFEVMPEGSIGRTIPLRQMSPELEREVSYANIMQLAVLQASIWCSSKASVGDD